EVGAALGIFAQNAAEIGRLHILRPGIADTKLSLGLEQGDVDLVDPRLLNRRAEDAGDLDAAGRGRAAPGHGEGGRPERAEAQQVAAVERKRRANLPGHRFLPGCRSSEKTKVKLSKRSS